MQYPSGIIHLTLTLTEVYNDFVLEEVLLNPPEVCVNSLLNLPPAKNSTNYVSLPFHVL